MEQNSSEWLEYRKGGLGASDLPIVMGTSPWKTAYQLWEEKTGLVVEDQEKYNYITEKGHRLEPKAKALYELDKKISIETALIERQDNPKHRASLDGYNKEINKVVEIKFVGAGEKWEMAVNGKIPEYYMQQMQWQLYVSGADSNDYVAFNEKAFEIKIITVYPDIEMIKEMVAEANKFWKLVEEKKEPGLSDRDYKKVVSKELKDLLTEYASIKSVMKDLAKALKDKEPLIKEHPKWNHKRMVFGDIKLIEKTRRGSVDYKKIIAEHLPDLDLTKYVKPSTTYKEIKI